MKRILIVDEKDKQGAHISNVLRIKGYYTEKTSSGKDAIQKAKSNEYDVVLLELSMLSINGMDVLMELRKFKPRTKVIIIAGFASIDSAVEAIKMGADDYISRPFTDEELDIALRKCLEEAKFDASKKSLDLDFAIGSLSNSIRRDIIKLLYRSGGMNLMEITRTMDLNIHTKALFHLKMLQDSDLIGQDRKKTYFLTKEGEKALECLRILENSIFFRERKYDRKSRLLEFN
jgi:DNA-binding response OmpR family regulator